MRPARKHGSAVEILGDRVERQFDDVRFGKIGTSGQSQTKSFASDDAAQKAHEKLVREKTKKGYREVTK